MFPEKELRGHSPNFHIYVSVRDLYIPTLDQPILLPENMWPDPGNIYIAHRHWTEAMRFPEKECINWIFVAVRQRNPKISIVFSFVSADDAGKFPGI